MPRCERCFDRSIGRKRIAILVLFTVALSIPALSIPAQAWGAEPIVEQSSATVEKGQPVIPSAPAKREQTSELPCGPRCQAAEQREQASLKAQQLMAGSNAEMVTVGWWQVFAAAAGFVLLLVTLKYTRDANRAAIRAAEAAEGSIEVTRDTARRELRAYVNIARAGLTIEAVRTISCRITMKNTGVTPAHSVNRFIETDFGENAQFATPPANRDVTYGDVGPGIDLIWTIESIIPEDRWADIINRRIPFFVYGETRHVDAFNEPRHTRFRLTWRRPGESLAPCEDGNEST